MCEKKMDALPTEIFEKIFLFLPYHEYQCWSLLSKRHNAVRVACQKRLEARLSIGQARGIPRGLLDRVEQTPRILFMRKYENGERFDPTEILVSPFGPLRGPFVDRVVKDDFHKAFSIYRNDIHLWFLEQFECNTNYVDKLTSR